MSYTIDTYWSKIVRYTEDNSDEIPEKLGVYEILTKGEDGYSRRYIGYSTDLRDRFLEHLSDSEENEDIYDGVRDEVCGFDYALLDLEADAKDAEQKLYDENGYDWNQARPEGSGRNLDIEVIEHNPGEE